MYWSKRRSIKVLGDVIYDFNHKELFTPIDGREEREFFEAVERAEGRANRRLTLNELSRLLKIFMRG